VNDPEVSVFINYRLVGSGKAARADLYPGTYRVYVQRRSTPGRMRTVQVSRGVVAELRIDWEFDSILHTSSKWTGGRFRTHGDRANRIAYVAKRIASELDAPLVVVFEFGQFRGQPVVTGTVYDGATGAMVRSGNVALAPDPSVNALGAFGRFLDSGAMEAELAAVIADGDHDDNQPQPREGGRRGLPRWVPWTGVAVGTAAVVGVGVLLWLDGRCGHDAFHDGPEACFTTYDTAMEGWLAVGAGVVLVGSAVTYRLVWGQPEPARHQIGVAPTRSGALFVVVSSF
jgi:hypothetical protein